MQPIKSHQQHRESTKPRLISANRTNGNRRLSYVFFRPCLSAEVHPKLFKEAAVIALLKPGRHDLFLPNSCRPISLIPCLGKDLERIIARRMIYCAMTHWILGPNQCGVVVTKRSAVYPTTALTCVM